MRNVKVAQEVLFPEIKRLISEVRSVTLRVHGTSMRPFLEGGRDKVVLSPILILKKGDIVLVSLANGQTVLHRIIQINGSCITLMGDGNIKGTETCDTKDVIARVSTIIRNGKQIDPKDRRQRFYAFLWQQLLPVRRYLLFVYRKHQSYIFTP